MPSPGTSEGRGSASSPSAAEATDDDPDMAEVPDTCREESDSCRRVAEGPSRASARCGAQARTAASGEGRRWTRRPAFLAATRSASRCAALSSTRTGMTASFTVAPTAFSAMPRMCRRSRPLTNSAG